MILILISLIAVTSIAVYAKTHSGDYDTFGGFICVIVAMCGFIGLFFYCFVAFSWFAAEHEMNIVNREYGTNYTQEEMFYASGVIDTVRELHRKRIEVNGDLITGDDK